MCLFDDDVGNFEMIEQARKSHTNRAASDYADFRVFLNHDSKIKITIKAINLIILGYHTDISIIASYVDVE